MSDDDKDRVARLLAAPGMLAQIIGISQADLEAGRVGCERCTPGIHQRWFRCPKCKTLARDLTAAEREWETASAHGDE